MSIAATNSIVPAITAYVFARSFITPSDRVMVSQDSESQETVTETTAIVKRIVD